VCAELSSVISIFHELFLVVAKKKIHSPNSMELSTRRYIWGRSGSAKNITDGHQTRYMTCLCGLYSLGTNDIDDIYGG
jgi:hypothetical protein